MSEASFNGKRNLREKGERERERQVKIKMRDDKRKIRCIDGCAWIGNRVAVDEFVAEPATTASFHSSLKYASMHARPG